MAKDYNITRSAGTCLACGRDFQPGDEFVATVREGEEELLREDFCPPCWDGRGDDKTGELLGHWRAAVPKPEEKKRRFVDDELIIGFFERLEGADEPAKVNFRFVLALVLMRKKLLIYERSAANADGLDVWTMRFKGGSETSEVVDPKMDEQKIAEISGQLGQVLEGEL